MNITEAAIKQVESDFQLAENQWRGCDWNTVFGPRALNLKNLTAKHTRLLANATSGDESREWDRAATALEQIEMDADTAKICAVQAISLLNEGRWSEALAAIENACEIEARYHTKLVWRPLALTIQRLVQSAH